uniref:Uncharacterized protein n=1 Tax=Sinocyclocheilus rhinocerous TaxID=307959 RepID=A0A673LE47_9TELE
MEMMHLRSLPTSALLGLGALTAVLAYWISTRPRPITPPCDLRLQSQEVQMEDGARRSMMGDSSTLLSYYHEDAKTMYEVFQRGLSVCSWLYCHIGHTLAELYSEVCLV